MIKIKNEETRIKKQNIQELQYNAAKSSLCCSFMAFLLIYGLVIIVCEFWRRTHEGCGIEVVLWCEILFIILLAFQTLHLGNIFFIPYPKA